MVNRAAGFICVVLPAYNSSAVFSLSAGTDFYPLSSVFVGFVFSGVCNSSQFTPSMQSHSFNLITPVALLERYGAMTVNFPVLSFSHPPFVSPHLSQFLQTRKAVFQIAAGQIYIHVS